MEKKKNRTAFWIIILLGILASLLVLNWQDLASGLRDGMNGTN